MIKLLVADDSIMDRARVSGLISKRIECTILEAQDGREALAVIEAQQPEIVLTDLQMPEMNGLELVTAVKDRFPGIPMILMTAQGSEEIAALALQQGAASYVPKRRLAEDLVRTVEHVLATSREERHRSLLMHYVTDCDMSFVVNNDPEILQMLVSHLLDLLRCMPLGDETERLRVGIALKEALSNAYYHGNLEVFADGGERDRKRYEELAREHSAELPYRNRRICVQAQLSREAAEFVIRDEGPGFDISRVSTATGLAAKEQSFGRGIVLMRSIMDEVSYNAEGNQVTLVKRCVVEDDVVDDED